MNDVRKSNSTKVKFYIELSGKVADAQLGYLHGKGFERVTVAWQKLKLRAGSIGSVCSTRFCASERKVYKAFFRNLTMFIADQIAENADVNNLNNIRSITFVVHICGTIDLLRPLKDLSLSLQAVNNLPWELDVLITMFISSMEHLEKDLRDKNLSRELSTLDSAGKPHRAFEYLSAHSAKAKQLKLELKGVDGSVVQQVDLVKSSTRRASRGGGNFHDATEEYDAAIINLADFAHEILDKVNARLANTPREERWIKRMAAALDFRAMAFPMGAVANGLTSAASSVAADIVSITILGLTFGAQIQVLVSEAGDPELWWPAGIGGPAKGAGGHGVIVVYDAWVQQGHINATTSRVCFNSDGQTLLDVDEMATWRWRRTVSPPIAPLPTAPTAARPPATVATQAETAAANAVAIADAAAGAALLGADAAATAASAEVFKVAWQVSQQGITARAEFDALLLLAEWMATRFDAAPPTAPPAASSSTPTPRPMPGIVVLWAQRCLLKRRLQEAATAYPYVRRWCGASGTIIMEDVFTNERFRKVCS
jgi:hypothetical protein